MNSNSQIVTKEISKGILLHKQQIYKEDRENSELIYIFKVEVKTLQILDFTADFSDSENLMLEGHSDLTSTTTIQPFSSETVAILRLFKNWKLKSRFRFTMRAPPKEVQLAYLTPEIQSLDQKIKRCYEILGHFPTSVSTLQEIELLLRRNNIKFIDIDFIPSDRSSFGRESSPFDTLIQWRRTDQFIVVNEDDPKQQSCVFFPQIEPSDIKEGALGDPYFVSALATLAELPPLIERLLITKDITSNGIYRVKLCKNGEWITITIDDFFPCYPDNTPIFSRAINNQIWVLLLEKAYAKLHGNYLLLRGGLASEALYDLTGCPTIYYNFHDEYVREMLKNGHLWQKMKEYDERGFLMSASTEGEERWGEVNTTESEDNILLPAHSYTILLVADVKAYKLLKIRNLWGQFEWTGDWCATSPLWTPELKRELNLNQEEELDCFWMCYEDFLQYFHALNICKVKNWQELRIKGKFIRVQDVENPNIEVVMSKWYYTLEIQETTEISIGIHQEDERIAGVASRRPYIDIGIAILKRTGENIELQELKDFVIDRNCQTEVVLDPGSYIILPRTTGCTLRAPNEPLNSNIDLLFENELHPLLDSTINDIFRKFDMLLNRELTFAEFKGFYECLGRKITEEEFKSEILTQYCSSSRGITLRGLKQFFLQSLQGLGEELVWEWLENLGYDRDLYSIRSRCIVVTLHSDSELAVTVKDNIHTDLDNRTNALIISQYGQESEVKRGVKALYTFSEQIHAYSYGILNEHVKSIEAVMDCSGSKFMLFSTKSPAIKKRIEPSQLQFMMHAQALPTANTFVRSAKCTWKEIENK